MGEEGKGWERGMEAVPLRQEAVDKEDILMGFQTDLPPHADGRIAVVARQVAGFSPLDCHSSLMHFWVRRGQLIGACSHFDICK
mmetsp:Transcript_39637/g.94103  ORF Transcript_39637/g.94103 Transcript_39637/m.94103 type:complete len:84 (-) Transcript_39637:1009-1260(-)